MYRGDLNRAGVAWAVVGCLAAGAGCAPEVLLEPPADWPQAWSGRRLYHTPSAYIYASSEEAAGEADRVVIAVGREFAGQTGGRVSKGLVVVTDTGDELFIDLKEMFGLAQQQGRAERGEPPMSEAEIEAKWREVDGKMDEHLDLRIDTFLGGQPFVLPRGQLADLLGLPCEVVAASAWAVVLPTRALISEMNRQLIRALLRHKEMPLAVKALMAPILVAAEPHMAEVAAAKRGVVVFRALADSQPDWSDAEKKRVAADFEQRWSQRAVGGLMSVVKPPPAAVSQPHASQPPPATQTAPGP